MILISVESSDAVKNDFGKNDNEDKDKWLLWFRAGVAMTFPADRSVFAFFGTRSSGKTHCFDCSFVSGVYWWIQVPSAVTPSDRVYTNMSKHCWEMITRLRFWSAVSKRGIDLADSFLMPKFSCRMFRTHSFLMFTISTISLAFTLRLANTISWILFNISSVVTSTGPPERGASLVLVRPHRNSVNHLRTMKCEEVESL